MMVRIYCSLLHLCGLMEYEGTHPEVLHLQNELKKRRDQRIQFASRKRTLEIENITKRRDAEDAAVWSTWKVCIVLLCFMLVLRGHHLSVPARSTPDRHDLRDES
jgi:hypothetical protein